MIKVRYSSIDGWRETRSFKTVEGARKFAVHYIGEHPEVGTSYAVSGDGVGRVTVEGCTIAALFAKPAGADLVALENPDPWAPVEYAPRAECESVVVDGDWEGPNEFGGSTYRPFHGWVRKADLARWEAESAARRAAAAANGSEEIPF